MQEQGRAKSEHGLSAHGIRNVNSIWWNLSTPALYEQAVQRHEGMVAHLGPLVTRTGQYTGRSPKDRFIVEEPTTKDRIHWGKVNHPFDKDHYEVLRARLTAYLQGKDLFVQDCYTGADPAHRLPIRVVTEKAWHSLFARNMFIQEHDPEKLRKHVPEYTILHAPGFKAVPEEDETNSEAFIILHLGRREVIIGGTQYGGEIKKAMVSI
ncbi:MAG: phosphoenolpyruvate carboxykinase (ATP), partial [Longimicrobiales bacterium]